MSVEKAIRDLEAVSVKKEPLTFEKLVRFLPASMRNLPKGGEKLDIWLEMFRERVEITSEVLKVLLEESYSQGRLDPYPRSCNCSDRAMGGFHGD